MPRIPYARRALSYPAEFVGRTLDPDLRAAPPTGFRVLDRDAAIGSGDEDFARARDAVRAWAIQHGAGFRMRGPSGDARSPMQVGDTATVGIGAGPLRFRFPVRVVCLVDEPDLAGFVYGTLPGHAECGEEAFLVERHPDGTVHTRVRAFSRPANAFWRLADPALRIAQELATRAYLRALR